MFDSWMDKYEHLIEEVLEHNYGYIDQFIDAELTAGLRTILLENIEKGLMHPAGIGKRFSYTKNLKIRGDAICWIEKNSKKKPEMAFNEIIRELIDHLNRTCYTGLNDYEFHYAAYDTGTFYKRHKDQFKADQGRKFSLVTYLNEEWTEADGGQLLLYLENETVEVMPKGGRSVFFRSDEIEHEVLPANRMRLSIAGWLKQLPDRRL